MPRLPLQLLTLAALATFMLCVSFLSACERSPSPPSSSLRSNSASLRLGVESASRIACLSPAVAITLKDLGLESSIIARHGYDLALSPSLPVAGDQQGLNYETLLTLNPTHVLLQLGSGTPAKLTTLAKEHNWAVTNYSILTLDDIQRTTRELHATFAPPGSPCPLLDRMTAVWSAPPDPAFARAGRIVLLASISPPAALGPGSFHHQILERLGATPAITQGSPFIELDAESLLALKPDGIILILPRGRDDALPPPASPAQMSSQLRTRLGALGKLSLPALDTTAHPERLALIDDPLAHTPSSAMLGVTEEMRSILTNWSVDAAAQQRHAPTPLNPK